jgi:cobalt-zinc-cadmium efflux system outer membrane protein
MRYRYLIILAVLALPAVAQPLATLVEEALHNNRQILAAQKRYEAARQRPTQAASLPDPTVSLGYTSNGGPWPVSGIGSEPTSNAGVMFSQEMPFPGKRRLRGDIAQTEAGAEFDAYRAIRLSVVARLKQAYHELHHANVLIEFVGRYQEVLQNMLRISEARYSVGRAAQQDVFKAQTQFSIFQTQRLRYEQERLAKETEINALLNRPQGGHIEAPEEMTPGDMPASLEAMLAQARSQSPMILRDQKMIQRSELAASLARREQYPDYTVSGGYFNQGSMPPMWQFRIDVKLPAMARRRAGINEQVFAAGEARHNYEATNVDLESRIRTEYALAATARKLVDLYEHSVIPEAKLTLESAMSGYQTGSLDFLSLFSNFMNEVEYEAMYHEEMMRFHVSLARLEEMTGGEVKP